MGHGQGVSDTLKNPSLIMGDINASVGHGKYWNWLTIGKYVEKLNIQTGLYC